MDRNPRRGHCHRVLGVSEAIEQWGAADATPPLPVNGFAPRGKNDPAQLGRLSSKAAP